jgi:AraC-like DNA-binding protein
MSRTAILDYFDTENNFRFNHSCDIEPKQEPFILHNHSNRFEVILFISGDITYQVEGSIYYPQLHDILIVQPYELHSLVLHGNTTYERIVLSIYSDFFVKNNCEEFKDIFRNRPVGSGNLLPSKITMESGALDAIKRIEQYLKDGATLIANCALMEFLYLLNKNCSHESQPQVIDKRIKNIIMYINEHITEDLSLNQLADMFFLNKSHLCRKFKTATGLTLSQYINYKKVLLVQELYEQGTTLAEASLNVGFSNYSYFYKVYRKIIGKSPSK